MDFQSASSFAAIFGALLVISVLVLLVVSIAMAARAHFAKTRAARLVVQARNLLTLNVFDRDEQGNPGPAELLGEAFRLQQRFYLNAEMIGLTSDSELDELINRAVRGNSPPAVPASEIDTLPEFKVQAPDFATDEDDLTSPDIGLGDRIAAAYKEAHPGSDDNGDEYLKDCADFAAGLPPRMNRDEMN